MMRFNVVLTLIKKELLNIIRDRKSFIFMILLPLLIFPILIGVMSLSMSLFTKVDSTVTYGVNYELSEEFKEYLETYELNSEIKVIYEDEDTLKEMFDDGTIGLYVIKEDNNYIMHFDENNTNYIASSDVIISIYQDYQEKYISDYLKNENIDIEKVKSNFNIVYNQQSVTEMGSLIPSIIAMALIMMISSVCFTVAIDITTSEKEKGTLETLLSLPIRKSELIASKFATVCMLSCMSGFLTYISLFITLFFAQETLTMFGVNSILISPKLLLIFLIAIVLVAILFSGLLLSVTIFSKSLKEAQNSLYPLEILVSIISMLPMFGMNASLKNSVIPFVNIALLFNNALSMNVDTMFVVMTFISTIIYSILLILIVSKIYNSEDILFNSKSLHNLSITKKGIKQTCYTNFMAILVSFIALFLSIYFSFIFASKSLYFLASITPVTILLTVFLSSKLISLDYKKAFKLNKFSIKKLFKLIPLYVGVYFIATLVVNVISLYNSSFLENYNTLLQSMSFDNLFLSIIFLAVLPAIAEEVLFRGVIFNSFNKKFGFIIGAIVSGLFFGVFHLNVIQGIFAFIVGIALCYAYYKTNSLFVPIIIHFLNNLFAVLDDKFHILNFTISKGSFVVISIISIILIILSVFSLEKEDKQ